MTTSLPPWSGEGLRGRLVRRGTVILDVPENPPDALGAALSSFPQSEQVGTLVGLLDFRLDSVGVLPRTPPSTRLLSTSCSSDSLSSWNCFCCNMALFWACVVCPDSGDDAVVPRGLSFWLVTVDDSWGTSVAGVTSRISLVWDIWALVLAVRYFSF